MYISDFLFFSVLGDSVRMRSVLAGCILFLFDDACVSVCLPPVCGLRMRLVIIRVFLSDVLSLSKTGLRQACMVVRRVCPLLRGRVAGGRVCADRSDGACAAGAVCSAGAMATEA